MTTWTRRGGYIEVVHKCHFLSTFRVKIIYLEVGTKVVKKGQICVHVVTEWPTWGK